jgi:hypothetical protein
VNGISFLKHKIMESTAQQKISSIKYEGEHLLVRSGPKEYKWKLIEISKKLSNASEIERNNFIISPSGYGIHWPLLDEDLSLNGLLSNQK